MGVKLARSANFAIITTHTAIPNDPLCDDGADEIHQLPSCRAVLDRVLKNSRPFRVDFRGVTVSPDAVMVQGFPADDGLSRLRDELRDAFRQEGLGENLDRRYKTVTAHLTVMRFAEPEADWRRLYDFLETHRETDFGGTRFQALQLIWSNWYASAGVARVLQKYPLKESAASGQAGGR